MTEETQVFATSDHTLSSIDDELVFAHNEEPDEFCANSLGQLLQEPAEALFKRSDASVFKPTSTEIWRKD